METIIPPISGRSDSHHYPETCSDAAVALFKRYYEDYLGPELLHYSIDFMQDGATFEAYLNSVLKQALATHEAHGMLAKSQSSRIQTARQSIKRSIDI
jgi:hypothetical protein